MYEKQQHACPVVETLKTAHRCWRFSRLVVLRSECSDNMIPSFITSQVLRLLDFLKLRVTCTPRVVLIIAPEMGCIWVIEGTFSAWKVDGRIEKGIKQTKLPVPCPFCPFNYSPCPHTHQTRYSLLIHMDGAPCIWPLLSRSSLPPYPFSFIPFIPMHGTHHTLLSYPSSSSHTPHHLFSL